MQVLVSRAGLTLNPGQMADLVLAWRQVVALLASIPRDRPLADDQAFVFRLPPPPDATSGRAAATPRAPATARSAPRPAAANPAPKPTPRPTTRPKAKVAATRPPRPAANKPTVKKPTAKTPTAKKPTAKKPTAKRPTGKPAARTVRQPTRARARPRR